MSFAPHPDGAMDRDLDTLWCTDQQDRPIASLTFFGCHPTSLKHGENNEDKKARTICHQEEHVT